MSAWIVSAEHIDVLVLASVQFGLIDKPTRTGLSELGASLWTENHRSINYRYDEDEQPPPYAAPTAEVVLDAVAVVKAVDCYAHQSGDHPEWAASVSAEHCTRLRQAAMCGLAVEAPAPGDSKPYPLGYDHAPWGITEITDACASATTSRRGAR